MTAETDAVGVRQEELDRVVHEPARLRILATLAVVESADFLFLQQHLGLTKGNLSAHLARLEEAAYIEVQKEFVRRIPRTVLHITALGREALDRYTRTMRDLLGGVPSPGHSVT